MFVSRKLTDTENLDLNFFEGEGVYVGGRTTWEVLCVDVFDSGSSRRAAHAARDVTSAADVRRDSAQ